MLRKVLCMLGLAGTLFISAPAMSNSGGNCSGKATHTGLKRTMNKTKSSIRKTSYKLRSTKITMPKATTVKMTTTPKSELNKVTNRVKSDDDLRDMQERK
jgi:hypothetical protein